MPAPADPFKRGQRLLVELGQGRRGSDRRVVRSGWHGLHRSRSGGWVRCRQGSRRSSVALVSGREVRAVVPRLLAGLAVLVLAGWAAGEVWVASIGGAETDFMRDLAAERSQGLSKSRGCSRGWAACGCWSRSPWSSASCSIRAGLVVEAAGLAVGLLGAVLIADLTKGLVSRPRPPVEHLQKVSSSSFPSTHATQASAFWFSLVLALRAAGARPRAVAAGAAAATLGGGDRGLVARVPRRPLPLRRGGGTGARLGLGLLRRSLHLREASGPPDAARRFSSHLVRLESRQRPKSEMCRASETRSRSVTP